MDARGIRLDSGEGRRRRWGAWKDHGSRANLLVAGAWLEVAGGGGLAAEEEARLRRAPASSSRCDRGQQLQWSSRKEGWCSAEAMWGWRGLIDGRAELAGKERGGGGGVHARKWGPWGIYWRQCLLVKGMQARGGFTCVTPQVSVHLNTDHCMQIKFKRRMWEINSKRKGQIKVKLHKEIKRRNKKGWKTTQNLIQKSAQK